LSETIINSIIEGTGFSKEKTLEFKKIYESLGGILPITGTGLHYKVGIFKILIAVINGEKMTLEKAADTLEIVGGYGRKNPKDVPKILGAYIRMGMIAINGDEIVAGEKVKVKRHE
jgi:hypothetical protein